MHQINYTINAFHVRFLPSLYIFFVVVATSTTVGSTHILCRSDTQTDERVFCSHGPLRESNVYKKCIKNRFNVSFSSLMSYMQISSKEIKKNCMCVLSFFPTFRNECYLNICGEKYGYALFARSQKDLEELLLKTMFRFFFIDHTLIFIILKHTYNPLE